MQFSSHHFVQILMSAISPLFRGTFHIRIFTSFFRIPLLHIIFLVQVYFLIIVEFLQKIADKSVVEFDWIGDVDGFDIKRMISIVSGIRFSIVIIEN